ncbi:MAG TPA: ABC-2 family transporter protein [Acidimicrobiales bacterium]|nr:ABC-2 family transporter protein [Acidimicrobiales bacterium]
MRQPWAVAATMAARRVVASPSALAVSSGFYFIVVSVVSALWRAAAGVHHGQVAGYSAAALTWYIAFSEAATVALNVRMIEYIGQDIADGSVAVELLRPTPLVLVRLATESGQAVARVLPLAGIGAVLALVVVGRPPSWTGVLVALPSLALAVCCNLAMQHAVAAAAFWTRDARSTWFLYQKFVFILGGMLLPLEVLPAWLHHIALALPFMAMSYVPARLASGHLALGLIGLQVVWLIVTVAAAAGMFAAGQRRLQVVGG